MIKKAYKVDADQYEIKKELQLAQLKNQSEKL